MKRNDPFRLVLGVGFLISLILVVNCILYLPNLLVIFSMISMMVILVSAFYLGKGMECRDVWINFYDIIKSQRDSLVWYVNNAFHGFKPPSYQLVIVESFYDKAKTIITELAKLKMDAERESRVSIINEIQNELQEWESIINQTRNRIDELDTIHRL